MHVFQKRSDVSCNKGEKGQPNRARNKRTSNVNDEALLAPDAPNLYLERQDDAANCLKL